MTVPNDRVYLIEHIYKENKHFKSLQHLVVRVKKITKDEYERFYCALYSNLDQTPKINRRLLHGNAKTLTVPYIRTPTAGLEREEELLHRNNTRPSMVCDKLIRGNDPYTSCSQSEEPRNLKKVQN